MAPTEHWRNQYGEMKANDAKRLKELERENATFEVISNVLLFEIALTGRHLNHETAEAIGRLHRTL